MSTPRARVASLTLTFGLLALGAGCTSPDAGGPGAGDGKADDLQKCPGDEPCLQFKSFEVVFTNPVCEEYPYEAPMPRANAGRECHDDCQPAADNCVDACASGNEACADACEDTRVGCFTSCLDDVVEAGGSELLTTKPRNVYCHTATDIGPSGSRPGSPQFRIADYIDSLGDGESVFLAFLSFSDRLLTEKLCDAVDRGVDVNFVVDKMSTSGEALAECGGNVMVRGSSARFAHVKLILVNPDKQGKSDDKGIVRMAFGSANLSAGTVLHHENWQFIEVARESFFVDAHRCLMEALVDEEVSSNAGKFRKFLDACRAEIPHEEETDITAYFIPNRNKGKGDSDRSVARLIAAIKKAKSVDIAVHRFSFFQTNPEKLETEPRMVDTLGARLDGNQSFKVRLVADDDLYWLRPFTGERGFQLGPNTDAELDSLDHLAASGKPGQFQHKFMQSNHASKACNGNGGTQSSPLLHHNKFIIFKGMAGTPDAVLTGSPNFTGDGFNNNFENLYFIQIPQVVEAYKKQFGQFWDGDAVEGEDEIPRQATAPEDMPALLKTINPPDLAEVCAESDGDDTDNDEG